MYVPVPVPVRFLQGVFLRNVDILLIIGDRKLTNLSKEPDGNKARGGLISKTL